MNQNPFVLRASAGSGKTSVQAREVARAAWWHGRIEIYVPTHKLGAEWRKAVLEADPRLRVVIVAGRGHLDESGLPLCAKHEVATELSGCGISVFSKLCSSTSGYCQHFAECNYIQQFHSSADVYIYTHAHLPLDRGFLDVQMPHMVVIDESFFGVCIQEFRLDIALLTHPLVPENAVRLCHEVAQTWPPGPRLAQVIRKAAKRGGGLWTATKALKATAPAVQPEHSIEQVKALVKSAPNFQHVALLLDHLCRAYQAKDLIQSIDFEPVSGQITVHHRRDITRFKPRSKLRLAPDINILDATATLSTTQALFANPEIHQVHQPRRAHVIQCVSSLVSTRSINPKAHTTPETVAECEKRLVEVQLLINQLSANGQRLLVVGATAITGNPTKGVSPLVKVPEGSALAHFNALRGVDVYKDFDAVLIIGRNEPPIQAVENMARALHYDSPTPLLLTGQWTKEPRGYRLVDGQEPEGVDVYVHPDSRVQDILEQLRESESTQAIDRLRLIHNTSPKLVVILCNIPLDIHVNQLLSWDELVYGSRIEQAWSRSIGPMPLAPYWLAETFPDLWPSAAAAKKDVQRQIQKGLFTNRFTIGKMSPLTFNYRGATQSRWSKCLSRVADLQAVSEALEAVLGHPVRVKGQIPAPPQ